LHILGVTTAFRDTELRARLVDRETFNASINADLQYTSQLRAERERAYHPDRR